MLCFSLSKTKISILCLFFLAPQASAQANFQGIILSKDDSTALPFMNIHLKEANQSTTSDRNGTFSFALNQKVNVLHLDISGLGIITSMAIPWDNQTVHKFYVGRAAFALDTAVVVGLSARQVVEKAIQSIPKNYEDSNYAYYSFYREYQKANGVFKNLVEGKVVIMVRPFLKDGKLCADEGFAIQATRRSNFHWDLADTWDCDGLPELVQENPVYHLKNSSLVKPFFKGCRFHFNGEGTEDSYVIQYTNSMSSNNLGAVDGARTFLYQASDTGTLVIDRKTFAFVRITRKSTRNKEYLYPIGMGIMRSKVYYYECVGGDFVVDYRRQYDKWIMSKVYNEYTNNFFRCENSDKVLTLAEHFELTVDSVSRYVDEDIRNKFFKKVNLPYRPYKYDSSLWEYTPPFYFYPKDTVYKDLSKITPVEQQFRENGNWDGKLRR